MADHDLESELDRLLDSVQEGIQDPATARYIRDNVWQEPALAVSDLLRLDALGTTPMPDAVVSRLWELGHAMSCTNEFLLETSLLARARPERRHRPEGPPFPQLLGGGHGPGRGLPGKREFPGEWSDDVVIAHTMDVARRPDGAVALPSGDFRAYGERAQVRLAVLVSAAGDVVTSYPVAGDHVVQNPLDERAPYVARLQALLDALVPPSPDEPRLSLDELMAVGEWPHVIASLRTLPSRDTQRADLDELARLAGLDP